MISMGLSAKQEKDNRFQQIKKEVVEMIKIQAPSLELKVCLFVALFFFKKKNYGNCLSLSLPVHVRVMTHFCV